MTRLVVDPYEPDTGTIRQAAAIVLAGGLMVYPTDTLYGLAADARNEAAARKLFDVKQRDPSNPIPLIAADLEQAAAAGRFGPIELRLAAAFWPGPLTIVVAASPLVAAPIVSDRDTVGIRVPAHRVARALAREVGACITATSANISGAPPSSTPDAAAAALMDRIEALLDAGPAPGGPPSTIVELTTGGPVLVRPGAIAWDRVLESLE